MTTLLHSKDRPLGKFEHPGITAKGELRARVGFERLKTLWFNTGSLCNIACVNCYIASSPTADHFVYLTPEDMEPYLDEIDAMGEERVEIAFTGGEPYLNPHAIRLSEMALERGHDLLVLTNAMKPMMRPRVQAGLLDLKKRFPGKMTLRVSLDHFTEALHDQERGKGAWSRAMPGLRWLADNGFTMAIAGREELGSDREGYAALVADQNWPIDVTDPSQMVLFPEMDGSDDVPEITVACWGILDKSPSEMMCSNSRMVVRRKGSESASVLACTLLWDDAQFELGRTLAESLRPVSLNHPHCAKFCVLGGASCSA